jgi:hypothetical protein
LEYYRLDLGSLTIDEALGGFYMSDEYGNDFISVTDDEGNEFELEHLDTIELGEDVYMAFLPTEMDEKDDDYGIVILKVVEEDGEEVFATVDDDAELDKVYKIYMERLFTDEDDDIVDAGD